jgi:hypothetical protein
MNMYENVGFILELYTFCIWPYPEKVLSRQTINIMLCFKFYYNTFLQSELSSPT